MPLPYELDVLGPIDEPHAEVEPPEIAVVLRSHDTIDEPVPFDELTDGGELPEPQLIELRAETSSDQQTMEEEGSWSGGTRSGGRDAPTAPLFLDERTVS